MKSIFKNVAMESVNAGIKGAKSNQIQNVCMKFLEENEYSLINFLFQLEWISAPLGSVPILAPRWI